jgi:hypothetical protein
MGSHMPQRNPEGAKDMVGGLIDSLIDRHSQLDVRLNNLTLGMPGSRFALQLSGTITVSVHMRELTDEEKGAHARAVVAQLHA